MDHTDFCVIERAVGNNFVELTSYPNKKTTLIGPFSRHAHSGLLGLCTQYLEN